MGCSESVEIRNYEKDRKAIRKQLIKRFLEDPNAKSTLDNIRDLRSLIVRDIELCATSVRESIDPYDCSATCIEGAEFELRRLYNIVEAGRYLKSADARRGGFVACPYGHIASHFTKCPMTYRPDTIVVCKICSGTCNERGGYHCAYCEYDLCDICSVIYCAEGHAMKLWTLAEGDHCCSICKDDPITSGYHCEICEVDICDLCSYLPGRNAVQAYQLREITELIGFLEGFVEESWTAKFLVDRHKIPETKVRYMTSTETLHDYVVELRQGKVDTQEQVKQHRIWKEVIRLREIIAKENNATSRRELQKSGAFTELEITRLQRIIQTSELARSVHSRRSYYMGCPVGHYAAPFKGIPPTWFQLERPPLCAICDRLADEGCHCAICEYTVCTTCSVVYCAEGHAMTMWTEPEVAVNIVCLVCNQNNVKSGYHCNQCNVDICDACTDRNGRDKLRNVKLNQLNELLALVQKFRDRSDVAYSYRHKKFPFIVSMKTLCEYVIELQQAMDLATRQDRYYEYICKMKSLRRRIIKYAEICDVAKQELETIPPYDFHSIPEVKQELDRLKGIIDTHLYLRSFKPRSCVNICCPLGHAMHMQIQRRQGAQVAKEEEKKWMKPQPKVPMTRVMLLDIGVVDPFKDGKPGSLLSTKGTAMGSPSAKSIPSLPPVSEALPSPSEKFYETLLNSLREKWNPPVSEDEPIASSANKSSVLTCKICAKAIPVSQCPWETSVASSTSMKSEVSQISEEWVTEANNCAFCGYCLCASCSYVYCRKGHICQQWMLEEAVEHSCDICYATALTAGYHCTECNVDICDACTAKDTRNVLLMIPKKEFKEIFHFMETNRKISETAMHCYQQILTQEYIMQTTASMNKLCGELVRLHEMRAKAEEEVRAYHTNIQQIRYGMASSEL